MLGVAPDRLQNYSFVPRYTLYFYHTSYRTSCTYKLTKESPATCATASDASSFALERLLMLLLRLPPSAPDNDEFPVVESPAGFRRHSQWNESCKSRNGFLQRKWRFGRCEGGLLQKAAPMCSQCGNLVTEVPMISLDRKAQLADHLESKAKRAKLAMPEPVCDYGTRMKGARKRTPPPKQFNSSSSLRPTLNSYITSGLFPIFFGFLKQRKSSLDSNWMIAHDTQPKTRSKARRRVMKWQMPHSVGKCEL